jgi:pseudaminic acid biosynthesis-associated methylase
MTEFKTDQERFWAGNFGADYISRNQSDALLASNLVFFSKALRSAGRLSSCIEFGANVGMNLRALQMLYPGIEQHAIEINSLAAQELRKIMPAQQVSETSILNFKPTKTWDLVLIKGVLIHINPDQLSSVYDVLIEAAGRYLLIAEYYNPVPVSLSYRGCADRLFKRDFAGELLDRHPNMHLIDYGFAYRRDPMFPQDDVTWFLLEKR